MKHSGRLTNEAYTMSFSYALSFFFTKNHQKLALHKGPTIYTGRASHYLYSFKPPLFLAKTYTLLLRQHFEV